MSDSCEREILHKGGRFTFERITTTTGEGERIVRDVVRHPGAVVVLAVAPGGKILMVRQRRVAVDETLLELPAGTLEAGVVSALGSFYTTPGLTDELMHAFIAGDLSQTGQNLDEGEEIEVVEVGAQEALDMIDDGRLMDAKSMLTILLARRRGMLPIRDDI